MITSKDDPDYGGSSSSGKSTLSGGQIAGIVIGAILGALLIAAAIAVFLLRKRRKWIGTGFAVAATKNRTEPAGTALKGPVFNDPPRHGSTPSSSVPFSADDIDGSRSRSTAEEARPASATISDSAAAAAGSNVELDGQDTAVRPTTELDGYQFQQKPLPAVAESPRGLFELSGTAVGGSGLKREVSPPRPPSTVGSLPSRDGDREGENHSPPSPMTSTFDGTWGRDRGSRVERDSMLVSPDHPTYRNGDRPF
jgi:hypothetical protein